MAKTAIAADWLAYSDTISTRVRSAQQWTLMRYLPFVGLAIHRTCMSDARTHVVFPRGHGEHRAAKGRAAATAQEFINSAGAVLGTRSARTVALDVLSPLLDVLAPKIRPVTKNLLNPEDKPVPRRFLEDLFDGPPLTPRRITKLRRGRRVAPPQHAALPKLNLRPVTRSARPMPQGDTPHAAS